MCRLAILNMSRRLVTSRPTAIAPHRSRAIAMMAAKGNRTGVMTIHQDISIHPDMLAMASIVVIAMSA